MLLSSAVNSFNTGRRGMSSPASLSSACSSVSMFFVSKSGHIPPAQLPSSKLLILDPSTKDPHVGSSDSQLYVCMRVCSYHLQNGGVAPYDEGQTAEALDAMGDSYRQLLL